MASPETREVVRSALRKVPCFINLDDEKKFSCCQRLKLTLHSAPGETGDQRGASRVRPYIYVLEGTMECYIARRREGGDLRVFHEQGFGLYCWRRPIAMLVAGVKVAEISAHCCGRAGHAHERRSFGHGRAATACVSWVLERRHARYLMKEGRWRLAARPGSRSLCRSRHRTTTASCRLVSKASSRRSSTLSVSTLLPC